MRRAPAPRRPGRRWSAALSLVVAFAVATALALLAPSGEPERVHRAAVGEWGDADGFRVRVLDVAVAERLSTPTAVQEIPGARFVVFTVESEALTKAGRVAFLAKLRIDGASYSPEGDVPTAPNVDPGFIATSQISFVVPEGKAASGTLVFVPSSGFKGLPHKALHVSWSDPALVSLLRPLPVAVRVR